MEPLVFILAIMAVAYIADKHEEDAIKEKIHEELMEGNMQ